MTPPIAPGRRHQPEPHLVHPEPIADVQHQHGPCGAERDVERQDREDQGPHRAVPAQPAGALGKVAQHGPGRRVLAPQERPASVAARRALGATAATAIRG